MKPTYEELEAERDQLMVKAEAMHLVLSALAAKVHMNDRLLIGMLADAESGVRDLVKTPEGLAAVRVAVGLGAVSPPPPTIDPERGEVAESRYRCPHCQHFNMWTDGTDDDFWCQTCGAPSPIEACERITGTASQGGEGATNG